LSLVGEVSRAEVTRRPAQVTGCGQITNGSSRPSPQAKTSCCHSDVSRTPRAIACEVVASGFRWDAEPFLRSTVESASEHGGPASEPRSGSMEEKIREAVITEVTRQSDTSKLKARLSDRDTLFIEGDVDLIALAAAIAGAVAGGP
jgi:hypothetical protein